MGLSADQFANIVESLGAVPKKGAGEKRRAPRAEYRTQIAISPDPEYPADRVMVQMRDFSTRGVGIVHVAALEVGQPFVIHLPRPARKYRSILCRVAHCTAVPGGTFVIGAEFDCVLPDADAAAAKQADVERIRRSILS